MNTNSKKQMHESIANKLIAKLNEDGIKCYIWHVATTGSVYIRFEDNRMCSVRIGDHDGREKLKYKFNIRTDIKRTDNHWIKDGDTWRYYVSHTEWEKVLLVLKERAEQIKTWPKSKYNYTIPKFKKKTVDFELTENYLKNG